MKKILIYGFYLLTVAALSTGCIKDDAVTPGGYSGNKLVLQMPDAQEVSVTRAATTAECRISKLWLLVYRSNALVHKQLFAAAAVTGNGTAQPAVETDYKLKTGDKVYVLANYSASVGLSIEGLSTGAAESALSAMLIYDNPVNSRVTPGSEIQPMYGSVTWSAGSNVCTLVRSRAKISITLDNSALFAGKTITYLLTGVPKKTSLEVVYNTISGNYEIPNVIGIAEAWDTNADIDNIIPLSTTIYCAPYPISMDAGGATVDKNTFDKRRSALILCATDASDAKEYYRLDFSRQLSSTTITGDASNEYLDIVTNTHYAFHIAGVKSGGYTSAAEAWQNPGSNIEYTVTVSGNEWQSSTSNGQYMVKTDQDKALVVTEATTALNLAKFACQMPDAGQKPGSELPGSIDMCTVTLVGADKKTVIPTSKLQLCKSDGTPVANNTFDFSGETISAGGYQLKYKSGSTLPTEAAYAKIRYGNIEHYVPLLPVTFDLTIPTTTFTYTGKKNNVLRVQSHYYDVQANEYTPCGWTAEYSTDGGTTWTAERPRMVPKFPMEGAGSNPNDLSAYPTEYLFDVKAQIGIDDCPHNTALRTATAVTGTYDLSTQGDTEPMSTANCYIVNAPGDYKFPLVYGNAYFEGNPNPNAYTAASTDLYILRNFVNHLDATISDPYIYRNAGCTPVDAVIVWQDSDDLLTSVDLSPDGTYISFTVDRLTIRQGNAIVAVRDAAQRIMWSWHIWVTDYELGSDDKEVTNYSGHKFTAMPINIGWCEYLSATYPARNAMVRITQTETGRTRTFTLNQLAATIISYGNNTYYQWGRKDPILPGVINQSKVISDKVYYPGEYEFDKTTNGPVSFGTSIQTPYIYYKQASSGFLNWSLENYNNLWSAESNTTSTFVYNTGVKTIYDPSPVGFMVAPIGAWSGFTSTGTTSSTPSQFNVKGTFDYGWNFYCLPGKKGDTVFFPATGYRLVGNGAAAYLGDSGAYWASTASELTGGYVQSISSGTVSVSRLTRSAAVPVRPVREVRE